MAAKPAPLVRDAQRADLDRIQAIYAHHVLHGLASFEETPPDLAEITRRFDDTLARGLPYLVAEAKDAGGILGYAYAGPYRSRPAYRFTVENSVYVAPGSEGQDIGRALMAELIERCAAAGCRQMVAIIGGSENLASIRLHEAFGFTNTGTIRSVGFKFGRWVDSVLMQLPLGEGDETLPGED